MVLYVLSRSQSFHTGAVTSISPKFVPLKKHQSIENNSEASASLMDRDDDFVDAFDSCKYTVNFLDPSSSSSQLSRQIAVSNDQIDDVRVFIPII